MKSKIKLVTVLALAASPLVHGGDPASTASISGDIHGVGGHAMCPRPDGHAPIGVMADHAHHAGEIMLGYRYQFTRSAGMIAGGKPIPNSAVYGHRTPRGDLYTAVPLSMDMHMHMWDIMYAPADWITLMLMPQYMEMEMAMESRGGHGETAHGGHGGHGGHTKTERMSHGTAGWGDTLLSAIVPAFEADQHEATLHLGISIPTGSVDQKMHGRFTHYDMQLGSGTWDLKPGLTYKGYSGPLSWGGQVTGTVRLEDENESGYSLGDVLESTAWTAVMLNGWASISGRVLWTSSGDIEGHYNGPHGHSSPVDIQQNYGGERLDLGLGLNLLVPKGALKGHRLAVEALWAVDQESNGVFMKRDFSLFAGWQFAF